MPDSTSTSRSVLAQIREILGLGDDVALTLDALQRRTRRQLLDCARWLGLTGVQSLTKATLASRFLQALESLVASPAAVPPAPVEVRDPARKFDLGQPAERREPDEHIPWGYGQDRVTALVVDPDRLYVYWEATDEAISRVRADLGRGGSGAWLNLRVYDVTGRLFDGTNAHGYFDHRIARGDRQWFFTIGRPSSSACVDLGLKSGEGYFVRIARSGRAEFPRREPAPPGPVEWLTVQTTGEPGASFVHDAPRGAVTDEHPAAAPEPVGDRHGPDTAAAEPAATDISALTGTWEALLQTAGDDGEQLAWEGPPIRSEWATGRLDIPLPPPGVIEEQRTNGIAVYAERGETRVVYSPWQVIIRGLGARAERRVLAVWQMRRSWTTSTATIEGATQAAGPHGASERRAGASESLGGASEVWRLGASELRLRGASELRLRGASELRLRGASELRLRGASERHLRGASERRLEGASEFRPRGASERTRR